MTDKPLRVALFSGNFNYIVDGAAKALNRLVGHLVKRDIPVTVFSPTKEEAAFPVVAPIVSVPAIPIPGRGEYLVARSLNFAPDARAALDAFSPTLIHISAPDWLGHSAIQYAEIKGLPSVASFHTRYDTYAQYYGIGFLAGAATRLQGNLYRRCTRVLAPTEETAAWLRENNMVRSLGRWARGIDRELFTPDRRSETFRRDHGVADDEVLVLFVARLVLEKGIEQFSRVVTRVREAGHKFRVMIVGDGPARTTFEAGVPDAIFTGFLRGEDLATAYASADILFYPSITEAFPNVVLEAMASGIPTLCADTTGANSVTLRDETGFLADPEHDSAYSEDLIRLITDADLRRDMGARGRKESANYTWDMILDEVIDNYREVLAIPSAH